MNFDNFVSWAMNPATGYAICWLFSVIVQSLPEPIEGERWYRFVYNVFQVVGANLQHIRKTPATIKPEVKA